MPKQLIWLLIVVMAAIGIVRIAIPPPPTQVPSPSRGELTVEIPARGNYPVGDYTITLTQDRMNIASTTTLSSVWTSAEGSFITAATGEVTTRNDNGMVRITDGWAEEMSEQTILRAGLMQEDPADKPKLLILGKLAQPQDRGSQTVDYELVLQEVENGLLRVDIELSRDDLNRLSLVTQVDPNEVIYGGGLQYHELTNMVLPVIPRLQGTGRGDLPLTILEDLRTRQGGSNSTTSAPLPRWVTSAPRSAWFDGDDMIVLDTRTATRLSATVWNSKATIYFSDMPTVRQQIQHQMSHFGAMKSPPDWAKEGLIVGTEGTSITDVIETIKRWEQAGQVPTAIWVHQIPRPDEATGLISLRQAIRNYSMRRASTDALFPMIKLIATVTPDTDLSTLEADGVIIEELETLSLKESYSDRVAEMNDWLTQLNAALAPISQPLIINRAGYNSMIPYSHEIALGKQLANFSENDGLPSALHAQLNGVFSGVFNTHMTVGGDMTVPIAELIGGVYRNDNFVARSAQLSAFSSIYRTGIDVPKSGVQLSQGDTAKRILRWYGLHKALQDVQKDVDLLHKKKEAISYMAAPILQDPDDHRLVNDTSSFYYGPDLFVSPIITPTIGPTTVELPIGTWRDVWTGTSYSVTKAKGKQVTLEWNLERIPMWTRVGTHTESIMEDWVETLPEYQSGQAAYIRETNEQHNARLNKPADKPGN